MDSLLLVNHTVGYSVPPSVIVCFYLLNLIPSPQKNKSYRFDRSHLLDNLSRVVSLEAPKIELYSLELVLLECLP